MPPALSEIELAEGATSELAGAVRDAIAHNLDKPQGRDALQRLRSRVLLRAEDTDSAVTLDFADGHGVPEVWAAPGRLALKRQLGGELTIRGLLLRARQLLLFLRLIAA